MTRIRYLVVALALVCGGCALTKMDPAHRLEAGEIVAQGALDAPGFLYVPRASGAVTYGLGGTGDIGLHAGTTILNVNAGGSFRLYLSEHLYLGAQGDVLVTTFEEDLFSSGTRFAVASSTLRLGRLLVHEDEHFYGGAQVQGIFPVSVQNGTDAALTNRPGLAAGGFLGLAFDTESDWDFQLEATGSPVGFFDLDEGAPGPEGYRLTPLPIVQIGLSVQYRKEKDKRPKPRPSDDTRIR